MQVVVSRAWTFLAFAVLFSFSAVRLWRLLSLRKNNKIQRDNILFSFNYVFCMSAGFILTVRFSLYFSVDQLPFYLNSKILKETYSVNLYDEIHVNCWILLSNYCNYS